MSSIIQARIACLLIAILLLAGCGKFPESCFDLSPTSRLPGWLKLPSGVQREDVTVQMCYFTGANGGTATFAMLNGKSGATLANITGVVRDLHPLTARNAEPAPFEYPTYEVITVGDITEAVEHRRMEPVFYVVDDPVIRHDLGIDK